MVVLILLPCNKLMNSFYLYHFCNISPLKPVCNFLKFELNGYFEVRKSLKLNDSGKNNRFRNILNSLIFN